MSSPEILPHSLGQPRGDAGYRRSLLLDVFGKAAYSESSGRYCFIICSNNRRAGPPGFLNSYSQLSIVLEDTPSCSASHLRGRPIPSLQALISAPVSFDRVILPCRNQIEGALARESGALIGDYLFLTYNQIVE